MKKQGLARNRVLNGVFALTFTLILCLGNINFSYGVPLTIFEDNFNIVAESAPKWSACLYNEGYDTSAFVFEGNASVKSFQGSTTEGSTQPIYHDLTSLNTNNGDYNITGWARTHEDHSMIGLDLDGIPCNFNTFTLIGKRNTISAANYTFIRSGGGGWKISNIALDAGAWFQVTHMIGRINNTHDFVQGTLNGTQLFNFTITPRITEITLQLHDARGGSNGVTSNLYDLVEVTQENDTAVVYATEGYIGGVYDSSNLTLTAQVSYIYVASVDKSIMINQTIYNILNYTNTFGNTWVTVVLYTAPNNVRISATNPLKAIWSETSVIESGTLNLEVNHYPNIITTDNQYVAIALSSSEDIMISGSVTNQTMYTYPVYAPYSIEYLNPSADTLGIRFLWNMIIPDSFEDFSLNPTNTFDLLNELNALAVQIGVPSILLYSLMFIVVLMGVIIILTNEKRESGDFNPLPPVMIGTFAFAILSFFAVTNMLPFEILIFTIVGISGIAALLISKTFLGDN